MFHTLLRLYKNDYKIVFSCFPGGLMIPAPMGSPWHTSFVLFLILLAVGACSVGTKINYFYCHLYCH